MDALNNFRRKMFAYVIKRLLLMLLTIWMVMSITFILLSYMPGHPYTNDKLSEQDIARLDHENGFDDPIIMRYLDYMTNIIGLEGLLHTPGGYDGADPILDEYSIKTPAKTALDVKDVDLDAELDGLAADKDEDNDGWTNEEEILQQTDPYVADIDTDGDGYPDAIDFDDDGDGLLDGDEIDYGLDPLDPSDGATVDSDNDSYDNGTELANGMDPTVEDIDTDGDGFADAVDLDDDDDGINDNDEELAGLDPLDPTDAEKDFDGDGMNNRDEIYSYYPTRDVNVDDSDLSREIFGFDFGTSFQTQEEVLPDLIESYGYSFTIGIFSLILGSTVGILLGLLAALKKNGPLDVLATIVAVIGVSFPSFIFATLLQAYAPSFFPTLFIKGDPVSFVLPILALSVFAVAQTARVTRTEMVEVLGSNFITLGRAKGVSNAKITFGYAFRNSMIAILTIFGPLMVSLTTGSLVVESIFGIPGLGGKMVQGVLTKDIYVVLGVTFFITLQITFMYLIVDLLYAVVDPRIRVGGKK